MRRSTLAAALSAAALLSACGGGPGPEASQAPDPDAGTMPLDELRDGFVEGLMMSAPGVTEQQASCAFDEAVELGVTFEDFIAIESSPELEAKFAEAFQRCGIR